MKVPFNEGFSEQYSVDCAEDSKGYRSIFDELPGTVSGPGFDYPQQPSYETCSGRVGIMAGSCASLRAIPCQTMCLAVHACCTNSNLRVNPA